MHAEISVIIPGVSTEEQVTELLKEFNKLPLGMKIKSSISVSGTLGKRDLDATIEAAGVAKCWSRVRVRA